MKWRNFAILLSVTLALFLALAFFTPARAVEFTEDGIIEAGEVVDDDLFISTDTVRIDGTVNGDLFINSSTATINGTVNGNLIVNSASFTLNGSVNGSLVFAGQFAEINGLVTGAIYSAGNSMRVANGGRVGRNLFFAGFSLEIAPESQVGRDIMIGGYQLLMRGETARDINASVSALEIGGKVGRNVIAEVDPPDEDARFFSSLFEAPGQPPAINPGLHIEESAQIEGELSYSSKVEQADAILSQPGEGIIFTLAEAKPNDKVEVSLGARVGQWILGLFRDLITLLVLGGLALWLVPVQFRQAVDQARTAPALSVGWGMLTTLGGFLGTLILGITILLCGILIAVVSLGGLSRAVFGIGFSGLGLTFAVFMLMLSYGSKLVVAQLGGNLLLKRLAPATAENRFWPLLLGISLYALLHSIPLLGWLFGVFVTFLGLGAIWLALQAWWKTRSAQTVVPAAPLAE